MLGRAKTSLHRVAQRIEGGDAPAIVAAPNAIRGEFEHLTREFNELTHVLNKGEESLTRVDVVAEARHIVRLYQKAIDEAQVEVTVPDPTDSLIIETYKGDLKVALHEVITNALEALGSDTASVPHGKLAVVVEKVGHDAIIRIADNGPGFCDDAIAHMFERGFTTRGPQHQGLGLYIAKRMMNQVGGDIQARNGPQGGAQVHLTVKNLGEA